ncbi:hypothetical protein [Staphylococcus nepalensis]|uniref:hypothetical protein n=1 Tax=Staphylococcus nepalensis TaxID=214473 RepID=UPI0031BAAB82
MAYEYEGSLNDTALVDKKYLSELKRKAKVLDEVKKYALSKYDEFEERKEFAGNIEEFEYYETLQIAKKAIINKCKQLEDE